MALTFCTDICCQITLNLKFIIVLVTICMNLISWQTAITDIYKHPVYNFLEIKMCPHGLLNLNFNRDEIQGNLNYCGNLVDL
jgi:hypothetical protein